MAAGNPSFGLTTQDLKSFGSSSTGGAGAGPTIIDAEAAGSNITVPGGTMLLTADFSKAGNDLVIVGADGQRVVVQDYFAVEPTPALRTAGGSSLPADMVERLAGAGDTMQFAQAGGGAVAGAQPIGTVDTVQGTVTAVRANGERVTLQAGDPVFQGDTIQTTRGGSLAVTFVDDSTFTVGDNARMVLDELVYDPATKTGTSAFSVVQGVFSFVSGAIAKTGSDAMTVRTPVATIGIRGTQVAVQANAEGENNAITLLQEQGGITGEIIVTNSAGSQVLNQPFQTTNIVSFFEAPTRPVILPEAQVRQMYGNAIEQLQQQINLRTGGGRTNEERTGAAPGGDDRAGDGRTGGDRPAEGGNAPAATQQAAAAPPVDDLAAGTVVAAAAPLVTDAIIEAAAQIAAALAAATGEDPAAAAARAAAAAAAGGPLDALIATAAGGNGFGGLDTLPAPNFALGTNSPIADAPLETQPQQIAGLDQFQPPTPPAAQNDSFAQNSGAPVAFVAPSDTNASAPTVTVQAATGNEDTAIALNIGAALTDTDGSESISSIVVAGVPAGATLSAGTQNANGTWTLTSAQLNGLSITPPANSDADFTLSVTVTSTESSGGANASTTALMTVTVNAVADAPTAVFNSVTLTGAEDQPIPLNLGVQLKDVDGSESITDITIAGIPAGATLSAGTNNGNGTWTLTPAQLTGLTLTPAAGFAGALALVVGMTSSEAAGGSATTIAGFTISVSQVADAPTVTVTNVTGLEDTAIPLTIGAALNDLDGSESISNITISGVPQGAVLSAGTNNGNGTWTLLPSQLNGLSITPPANSDADFTLGVSATSTEAGDGSATALGTFTVDVTAPSHDHGRLTGYRTVLILRRFPTRLCEFWAIPGAAKARHFLLSAVMSTYGRAPVAFERGEGPYLYDGSGRRYLDFAAGVAVVSLGHCHPHLVETLKRQAETLWHTSNLYRMPGQERLAARLVEHSFADKVFFCNSGAEAVEGGLKLVRRYHDETGNPQRYRVLTFAGAFHGRTLATLAAGNQAKHLAGYEPKVEGFDQVAFGDLEAARSAITKETAAILVEPLQGEGGARVAPPGFLRGLRKLCDEHGILLFLDEVQTGIGRTGRLFAYEWEGITPDVMAIAKGLGGGFPIGAFLATEKVAAVMTAGTHGSTFGGNLLATAVGNAVLDVVLAEGFLERVRRIAGALNQRIAPLASEYPSVIAELRGSGLLLGLRAAGNQAQLIEHLRADGLLTAPAGDNVVRLVPPLVIDEQHVDEAGRILEGVCRTLAS